MTRQLVNERKSEWINWKSFIKWGKNYSTEKKVSSFYHSSSRNAFFFPNFPFLLLCVIKPQNMFGTYEEVNFVKISLFLLENVPSHKKKRKLGHNMSEEHALLFLFHRQRTYTNALMNVKIKEKRATSFFDLGRSRGTKWKNNRW